jgi:uncharacterized membrane protein required for colicin V production
MVPLDTFLWAFVLLFGLMGALRGWSKEMLVLFSVIVALAMPVVFEVVVADNVPQVSALFDRPPEERFYIDTGLLVLMTIAGYAGPVVSGRLARSSARETLQDILLGFIIGAANGYLIFGSIWFFMKEAGYGIWGVAQPAPNSIAEAMAEQFLPPVWLTDPILLTVFVFASVFVIIVLV